MAPQFRLVLNLAIIAQSGYRIIFVTFDNSAWKVPEEFLGVSRCMLLRCATTTSISELFDSANESLFKTVLSDRYYVLHRLLRYQKQNCTM